MKGLETRPPAVAGLFYESDPGRLRSSVRSHFSTGNPRLPEKKWRALLLPHAGHIFSGHIAGSAISSVDCPPVLLFLGPNHHGVGAPVAVSQKIWSTPLGDVWPHRPLLDLIMSLVPEARVDDIAHTREHSVEVLMPFFQVACPSIEAVCISVGQPDLDLCVETGKGIARAIRQFEQEGRRCAVIVSSDMNHFLKRKENRLKDLRAIDAILSGDPAELFHRVLYKERISMCGILPTTVLLAALTQMEPTKAHLLAHGDSADKGGDEDRVVGYASIVWEVIEEVS